MKKTKLLSILLSVVMLFSCMSMSVFALEFDDVENDPTVSWAQESIHKMTDAGYIKGYEDGTFRPYRAITKMECLILMSRMLGLENADFALSVGAALDEYKTVAEKYNTTYAKELSYLLYCGVLVEKDLVDYASVANANTQLLRYQSAMLMAKLMGADAEAKAYSTSIPTYADNSSIPANAKPYVEFVTANDIMNGMDADAEGNPQFSPVTSLTRAQMATLLARMMDKLDLTIVSGTVDDISNDEIEIDGKAYGITPATKVYMSGDEVKVSNVSEGDNVSVIVICGNALVIETEESQEATVVYGVVVSRNENSDGQRITIADYEDDEITATYSLKANCKIYINDSKGAFGDLKADDFVMLQLVGGRAVEISTEDKTLDVSGTLDSVEFDDEDHVYINVGDSNGENVQNYVVSVKGAKVTRDGDTAEFRDLSKGDSVTLKLTYGKVTSVSAKSKAERFTGLLSEIIISSNPSITIVSNGESTTYKLRPDVKITVAGSEGDIYDLRPNITVSGMLDSSEVKSITASSVTVNEKGEMVGKVTGKNTNYYVITIEDEDGNAQSIYYSNSKTTFLNSDGKETTAKAIETGATISVTGSEKNGIFEATIIIVK